MQKNEYPLVHIYPQSGPLQAVCIVANTEGLLTLVTALIEATSIIGKSNAEVFDADAEAYEVVFERNVYAKQVQEMMSLLEVKEILAKKLRRETTVREWASYVHESESELNETIRCGQRAKRQMVEANLRLMVAIAKQYQK